MMIDVYTADKGKILKEIIKLGDGELVPNTALVIIHYTGNLLNGTQFDSSRNRYGPFKFNVGEGKVIAGLDIGIVSMRKGEQAILTIAPEYAYGSEGNPPSIPPDAVLKFDVEVLDWKEDDLSPDKDGSIIRTQRIQKGIGYTFPKNESFVEVHLNGKFKDKCLEDRDLIFKLGYGEEENVVKGVDIALQKFKLGEKSTVIIKSKYAFNIPAFKDSGLPVDETVEYTIELKQFEKPKDAWSLDEDEKIKISEMFKEKGNQYFKRNEYVAAINTYRKILDYLLDKDGEPMNLRDKNCTNLVLSAHLNLCLCCLRIQDYELSLKTVLDAIRLAPQSEKAHYRCGQAYIGLLDYENALHHLKICLDINPANSEAKDKYSRCMKIMRNHAEMEKKRYLNMFEKFAEADIQEQQSKKD